MPGVAAVITNGDLTGLAKYKQSIELADTIICVDGAARRVLETEIKPDVLLGDLDSIDQASKTKLQAAGVSVEKHPAEKDQTDTELALDYCVRAGLNEVRLFGAVGSRLDHSLANIFLFIKAKQWGLDLMLYTATGLSRLVNSNLNITGEPGDIVSLLPLSATVTGVTLTGLKYPLTNAVIQFGSTQGISNQLTANTACITVERGTLLVIHTPAAYHA